jgi:hypothetical protein
MMELMMRGLRSAAELESVAGQAFSYRLASQRSYHRRPAPVRGSTPIGGGGAGTGGG